MTSPAAGGAGKIALDPTGLRASARKLRDARGELDVDATRLAQKPVPVMPDGVAAAVEAELAAIAADIRAQSARAGAAADELDWRVLVAEVDDALANNAPLSAATIALLTRELATGHPKSHLSSREAVNIGNALRKIEGKVGFVNGVGRYLSWMNGTAGWDALIPDSPLGGYAALLTLEHFPTMNNGRIFGAIASRLSRLPGPTGRAGGFLTDATRATPFFRGFGIAANVVGTGVGVYETARDWHKGGAQLATDITGTAFNASSVAFLVAPNPLTGAVVIVAGVAWGGAEAWQHHKLIEHETGKAASFVWDHSVAGELWNDRPAVGKALDKGIDIAGSVDRGIRDFAGMF